MTSPQDNTPDSPLAPLAIPWTPDQSRVADAPPYVDASGVPEIPPIIAAPLTLPLHPTPEPERIATLDVLRGVAVLGIFLVNVGLMAFPLVSAGSWRWDDLSWPDRLSCAGVTLSAEMKFITLFSLLFGMGLALQQDRADRAGRPFTGLYALRLSILFLIGVLHGVLLWFGDILSAYAVLGFIALLCRRLNTKVLLLLAAVLMLIPLGIMGGCMAAFPDEFAETGNNWFGDDPEETVYREGGFGEILAHRSFMFVIGGIFMVGMIFSWRCLSLFFVGICLLRSGMLVDPAWPPGRYRAMILWGLLLGLPLHAASFWTHIAPERSALLEFVNFAALYVGSLGLAAAYAGAVALWCRTQIAASLQRRLAAVGRMALTNYLMHSLIGGLIFYSYGLGLFGLLAHWQTLGIVLAVFGLQLLLSPWWLSRFRYGPMEWLWRCGTYGRWEQMRIVARTG